MDPTSFAAWAFSNPFYDALASERPHEPPMSAHECAESLSQLGEAPALLDQYSDDQLTCGLRYLFHGEISDFAYLLRDGEMPLHLRQRALRAIGGLYAGQLDRRLAGDLVADPTTDSNSLVSVTFMLWDVSPLSFWPPSSHADICRAAFIDTLAKVLHEVDSLACKESVLHGLGHMCHAAPGHVSAAIGRWLDRRPGVPEAPLDYARQASTGMIQ